MSRNPNCVFPLFRVYSSVLLEFCSTSIVSKRLNEVKGGIRLKPATSVEPNWRVSWHLSISLSRMLGLLVWWNRIWVVKSFSLINQDPPTHPSKYPPFLWIALLTQSHLLFFPPLFPLQFIIYTGPVLNPSLLFSSCFSRFLESLTAASLVSEPSEQNVHLKEPPEAREKICCLLLTAPVVQQ